ncbi:MAG: T9SS type A sorting domain-containing protein [Candidatus Eisenbacteria bacterium]|uniref:T9SS type A sorting domain-containing protein n=1 Tax=Eiseniibacteriota bacterium TaxID=2212470 RepID=A0A849SLW6_UNCEI|nr:T9SS type A sorting domain-containing protein [Candidatus Eisenbacteria bacterium]
MAAALLAALLMCSTPSARAQVADGNLWTCDWAGLIESIARYGDTLVVGGFPWNLGPASGAGVPVDPIDGRPHERYAKVAGVVHVAISDGCGGWYVGGEFTGVGGLPRRNLAHVRADGSVDDWSPGPDGEVRALLMAHGRLYVGGRFGVIAGASRSRVAAFDLASGEVMEWAPQALGWAVRALAFRDSSVYVGGDFEQIGGADRYYLAEISATTGQATEWNPVVWGIVEALAIHDRALYAGGRFSRVGPDARKYLAAIDLDTGRATAFDAQIDRQPEYIYDTGPRVRALAVACGRLYVAGAFDRIGGQARESLAAVDLETGEALPWNPRLDSYNGTHPWMPYVHAMVVQGNAVYFGGQFQTIGDDTSPDFEGHYAAAVSALTAERIATWQPRTNGRVQAIAADGSSVFLGGDFTSVRDWVKHLGLAAIDLRSGRALDWSLNTDGSVKAVERIGDRIFVAGGFGVVGGKPRANLAAIDARTGELLDWAPNPNGGIWSMARHGDKLLVSGTFRRISGQPRNCFAELDPLTGAVTAWDPNGDYTADAMVVDGDRVYLGGGFDHIGGVSRVGLAAVDATTGALLDWYPGPGQVFEMVLDGDLLLLGGYLQLGGGERGFATVNKFTGALVDSGLGAVVLDRDNFTSVIVRAMSASNGVLYLGGDFDVVNGERRFDLAAIDMATGTLLSWDPGVSENVWSLLANDVDVFAGGHFWNVGVAPQSGLVRLSAAQPLTRKPEPDPEPIGPRAAVELAMNNPADAMGIVRLVLAAPSVVDLDMFDSQGRRVATVMRGETVGAGTHEVRFATAGMRNGCYFLKLTTGGLTIVRRVVVLH